MHINKYLVGIVSIGIIGSIGWLSAGSLNISNSNFAKGFPIFKTIFFRTEGKDTINGSTNPESIRLDSSGIYTAVPGGLPGGGGNVLKLNGSSQVMMDPVQNGNITNDSISSIKIQNGGIINSNFADLAITNAQIQNNTINKVKFDPAIVWPTGGTMFITNNVCTSLNAIVSVTAGTATCALLPTGSTSLPTCSAGQQPVFSGGIRTCVTFNIGTPAGDPYRTGSLSGYIKNSNVGNVGVGTPSPLSKLTVSGSLEILGETEEQVYCYATDTWVPLSLYNSGSCAGCNPGFSFNPVSSMCEQNSCIGGAVNGVCGSSDGQTLTSAPISNLCTTGNATPVMGSGPWTWSCNGINGGTNDNCSANAPVAANAYNPGDLGGGGISGICELNPGFTYAFRSPEDVAYSTYANVNVDVTFDIAFDNAPVNCHRTATATFTPGSNNVPLTFIDGMGPGNFTCGTSNYCSAFLGDRITNITEY